MTTHYSCCIEKSSKLLQSLVDNDDNDNTDDNIQLQTLFEAFASNKQLHITSKAMNNMLSKFNRLHDLHVFTDFKPPNSQEYFCKQLNLLLIVDFILTFFKNGDTSINIQSITTEFIFDFFCKLGDFYAFLNYLDVDESILNYLKYMLILYLLQLERPVIEIHFQYCIETLDEFFRNEIMTLAFRHIKYSNLGFDFNMLQRFHEDFTPEYFRTYCHKHDYNAPEYDYLNDYFNKCAYSLIITKNVLKDVPNPRPQPDNYSTRRFRERNVLEFDDNDSNYDSDEGSEDEWTPMVKRWCPVIESTHPKYEEYKQLFCFRKYQQHKRKVDTTMDYIKHVCRHIQINQYTDFEPNNTELHILQIKTILNCLPKDAMNFEKSVFDAIWNIACEHGHLTILENLIVSKNGNVSSDLINDAMSSPNRDVIKMLQRLAKQYTHIKTILHHNMSSPCYEPKITFF